MYYVRKKASTLISFRVTSLFVVMATCVVCRNDLMTSQCHATCLEEFQYENLKNASFRTRQKAMNILIRKGRNYLDDCLQHDTCSQCSKPCSSNRLRSEKCVQLCQINQPRCLETCSYLQQIKLSRPGSCPSLLSTESRCLENCRKDGECEENLKCCKNGGGCGRMCQKPASLPKELSAIPKMLTIEERHSGSAVHLSWVISSNRSKILIYVVQSRKTLKSEPDSLRDSGWLTVAKTTRRSIMIRHIKAGHWYEFRVASVCREGSRGFSDLSRRYKSSRDIEPPKVPEDFSEDGFTVHNGKIDVTLVWVKPKSDLPLSKYIIYWSRRLNAISPVLVSLSVNQRSVPRDQTSCVLENLQSGTTYHVEIEAIAKHNTVRLKSRRSSMFIRTYAIPNTDILPMNQPLLDSADTTSAHKLVSIHQVTIGEPYYFNGVVNAMVKWTVHISDLKHVDKYMLRWVPTNDCDNRLYDLIGDSKTMAATTHQRKFIMYDLVYGCVYTLKAQVVNDEGRPGAVYHTTFSVPVCRDIRVKGHVSPHCANNGPPPKLRHVGYNIYITGPNITAVIKWRTPDTRVTITGYTVEWGVKFVGRSHRSKWLHRAVNKVSPIDADTLHMKTLPKNRERLELSDLQPSTQYVVYVRGLSNAKNGPITTLEFSTPAVHHPIPPPDINKFIEEGSRKKEQAFESRGHLHGYRNTRLPSPILSQQKHKPTQVTATLALTNVAVTFVSFKYFISYLCLIVLAFNT